MFFIGKTTNFLIFFETGYNQKYNYFFHTNKIWYNYLYASYFVTTITNVIIFLINLYINRSLYDKNKYYLNYLILTFNQNIRTFFFDKSVNVCKFEN